MAESTKALPFYFEIVIRIVNGSVKIILSTCDYSPQHSMFCAGDCGTSCLHRFRIKIVMPRTYLKLSKSCDICNLINGMIAC